LEQPFCLLASTAFSQLNDFNILLFFFFKKKKKTLICYNLINQLNTTPASLFFNFSHPATPTCMLVKIQKPLQISTMDEKTRKMDLISTELKK
jgi:hypothetical protein